MECAVYDTYVQKSDGKTMHFDVVVEADTPHEKAIEYGKQYLASVGQAEQNDSIRMSILSYPGSPATN